MAKLLLFGLLTNHFKIIRILKTIFKVIREYLIIQINLQKMMEKTHASNLIQQIFFSKNLLHMKFCFL